MARKLIKHFVTPTTGRTEAEKFSEYRDD